MRQIRISILSNAGGSGKTTLATHLSYILSESKISTVAFDLDPQGSLGLFCGIDPEYEPRTISDVFDNDFAGSYPLIPLWEDWTQNISMVQANIDLLQAQKRLQLHGRGPYILSDILSDYPIDCEVVLFDCPAMLGILTTSALISSTHILIPFMLDHKCMGGVGGLLTWLSEQFQEYRLKPPPEILGLVPCQYEPDSALSREALKQVTKVCKEMGLNLFPPIKKSLEFRNAIGPGLPIHLFRPKNTVATAFKPIQKSIKKILTENSKIKRASNG